MNDDYKNDLKDFFLIYDADRKSTRLNSSHSQMSYAVFCLKKKITNMQLANQKDLAVMHNATQKEIASIHSTSSRENTQDEQYAQNEMRAHQQKESPARVAS